MLLVSGWVSVPKPSSQIQRSTRWLLQGLSPRPSFGGFGLREAAHHLNADELRTALDRHFGLDNLRESNLNKQADGCTIAALLMMNAAMLHQRIANGRWLSGVSDLAAVKNDVNVVRRISREWDRVMRHDFRPVLEPAVEAIQAIEDTGKLTGLERALRHIATEAERIAETYADMGADHAGPLFNKVMGNQASDGAYFTRPVAASIAARLTLDACGDVDWTDPAIWRAHKTVDLACGSGTLLAAILTDVNCRAKEQGATEPQITALQKLAVEETIKGLDINPVSLQLAASQLTAGNHNISYRQMGLHLANGWGEVSLWPTERIETGDWTPAAWRSPVLAREAAKFANHSNLHAIKEGLDYTARSSMQRLYENFEKSEQGRSEVISVLESKGAAGQKNIESVPDSYWFPQKGREKQAAHYLKWASHLLITSGQRNNTARLTATASNKKHLGIGWSPVVGLSFEEAKAASVFVNSTAGRLQLMRNPGQSIDFPTYKPKTIEGIKVPDVKDARIRDILADCWERTKDTEVPQSRDGECEVRRLWDESVAEAMGWDPGELASLRELLHNEPHVRGLGYNQYADESADSEETEDDPDGEIAQDED